jgi:hypothetical protein
LQNLKNDFFLELKGVLTNYLKRKNTNSQEISQIYILGALHSVLTVNHRILAIRALLKKSSDNICGKGENAGFPPPLVSYSIKHRNHLSNN